MNNYEGMFLFDPAVATDWEHIKTELDRLMGRAEARMIAYGKWDERRLAYEIRGRKRAIYVLTYFAAEPDKISSLERDVQLSEAVIRCLILRVDHLSEDGMKQVVADSTKQVAPPSEQAAAEPKAVAAESKAAAEPKAVAAESKAAAEPKAAGAGEEVSKSENASETITADVADNVTSSESASTVDSDQPKE